MSEECPICGYTKGMKEGTVKMMISFLLEDFTEECILLLRNHFIWEFLAEKRELYAPEGDYKDTEEDAYMVNEIDEWKEEFGEGK